MNEHEQSEARLIEELRMLRERTAELERAQSERKQAEEALKSALDESRRRRKETTALLEGARAVLRYRDFEDAARVLFDSCKNLIGASAGYVALLAKEGTENEVLFLDSGGLPCSVDPSLPMPIRGLRAEAYRTGKVVYENNFAGSEWVKFMPEGHAALDNVMFAPLVAEEQTIGLLGLANKPGGFHEDDARMARAFGELASIALLNSRTLEFLENSEKRLRSVVETAADAIITADSQGNIVFWNEGPQKVFGYSAEELLGKPLTTIMPERFHEAHRKALARVVSTGETKLIGKTVEIAALRKDGSEFPVELSLATWRTRDGAFFTALCRDITERKRAEETRQISQRFLQIANLHAEMDPLLTAFVAELKSLTRCEAVGIRILDEEGNIPYEAYEGFSRKFYDLESPLSVKSDRCMCINVIKGDIDPNLVFYTRGGSFYMNGTTAFLATVSDEEKGQTRNACNEHGYESVALIPIRLGSRIVGLIHVADTLEDAVPLEKVEMLEGIAMQLGAAIQRVRAEEEVQNVARFPSENPWPVLRIGQDGTILYANAASASLLGEWRSQIGQSAPGYIVDFAAKVLDSGSSERLELEHMGRTLSFAVVPVAEAGHVNLYGRDITERVRAEEELEKHRHQLEELVNERTAELERSRQQLRDLAAHMRDAREEERAWVAREIHDELGQMLTGLELDLSWLNTKLPEVASGESRQLLLNKISSMSSLVDSTIECVQRIATELRPGVLDDFGLLAAIESQARQFQERTGIKCRLVMAVGDANLEPATSTALFRIIQEALTNVARHAEATKVAVSLKCRDDKVTLLIKDNGKGIAGGEVLSSTSLGFLGMRERAVALGGEFDVAGAPLKGTTIKVSVPLRESARR